MSKKRCYNYIDVVNQIIDYTNNNVQSENINVNFHPTKTIYNA